ncbi:MAG: hypothetical protein E7657_06750 [Ruminococcaceae bacterium]|nr:hypothetical protein [Oscillospiraceae bacterium]
MLWLNSLVIFLLAIPLGLGIGGGGLFLIYLGDVLGIQRDTAVYLNLIFFLSALIAAAVGHLRAGRLSFSALGTIILFGVPGAFLGKWLSSLFSPMLLHLLLGVFLLTSGILSLLSLKKAKNAKVAAHSLDKR